MAADPPLGKSPAPDWIQARDGGVELRIRVQPRASRTEVVGPYGDELKLRLSAPPVDGKANKALIAFLADTLGLPRAAVTLASGTSGRSKRVLADGISVGEAVRRMLP